MTALTRTEEVWARLSLHEALLEVLMANQLVMFDERVSRVAKLELVQLLSMTHGHTGARPHLMSARIGELAKAFVEKLSIREAEIRAEVEGKPS